MQVSHQRGPERRRENRGGPDGRERRALGDRRGENNALYVHFEVEGTSFLAAASEIQEIVAMPRAVRVPLAPPGITGLINLRGQIMATVDLRRLLGADEREEAALGVVAKAGSETFALIVDEVHDVLEISPTMLHPPPANLAGAARTITRAVCPLPDALMLVFDPDGLGRLLAPEAHEGGGV